MLQFCRTKFVGFEQESAELLKIYGTLDDTLYAMEIELTVKLPELVIIKITGKMRRYTTPFCEEAQNFLRNAEGLKIEPGFQSQVKKVVGRPGCQHLGNLINECCESIIPALLCMKYKELKEKNPNILMSEVFQQLKVIYPQMESFCATFSHFNEM
jgi:hypothetical protein